MSEFYFVPKKKNPDAQGYLIKIMGLSYSMTKKEYEPVTIYSHKIYSSERNVLNSFSHAWDYFCCCEKQVVCCAYDTKGIYQFSFVRDPESKKITKIDVSTHTLPEHMLYYDHKFIPGQSKYPLSLDELDEVRKELVKSKAKDTATTRR